MYRDAVWAVETAIAKLYKSTGHGIVLELGGSVTGVPSGETDYLLDVLKHRLRLTVAGRGAFRALPAGVETLAKMSFLPLRLASYLQSADVSCDAADANRHRWSLVVEVGTKNRGTFGVSHKTLVEHLRRMTERGDEPFAAEFLHDDGRMLFALPTKPSLLLGSAAGPEPCSVLLEGPLPDFHRRSAVAVCLEWARLLALPALFAVAAVALALLPALLLPHIPDARPILHLGMKAANLERSFADVLPPVPEKLSVCWQLAQLEARLTPFAPDADAILAEATQLLKAKRPVTAEQLHGVLARLLELEAHRGIITRVRGLFTFVNAMWLLAILGVGVSLVPVMFIVGRPVMRFLARVASFIWNRLVFPILKLLHTIGVFELAVYLISFAFVSDGARRPGEWGIFITLTGLVLSIPCFAYSLLLHGAPMSSALTRSGVVVPLVSLWIAAIWMSWAVFYSSHLLAFFSVAAFYSALGFSVVCFGLCWCIGWRNAKTMERTAVASALLLLLFSGLRVAGVASELVELIGFPCQVFGTITLLLALLIMSSMWRRNTKFGYAAINSLMVAVLALCIGVGSVYDLPSIRNTAFVFAALYLGEKQLEIVGRARASQWISVFVLSIALWRAALFLHTHPGFIAAMFSSW